MTLLWLCNGIPGPVAALLGMGPSPYGGWVSALLPAVLAAGHRVVVLYPVRGQTEGRRADDGSLAARPFPSGFRIDEAQKGAPACFEAALQEEKPDVVHIFGTEYIHSLQMAEACAAMGWKNRVAVQLQGMMGAIAEAYMADAPERVQKARSLRNLLMGDGLAAEQRRFARSAQNEGRLLGMAGHAIGRTAFDKADVIAANPAIHYHHCSEMLRETFYESAGAWRREACRPHTVFASQASYPLKGFHKLVLAFKQVWERYPDARLITTGRDVLCPTSLRDRLANTAYQNWLAALIRENGLEDAVEFTGELGAKEMKAQYLQSRVFACPSACENSPNSLGEAMLLGVPCVAARVGGVPSMMDHEKEGLLYDFEDVDALAGHILRLFENETLAARLGQAASARAAAYHDREEIVRKTLDVYRDVAGGVGEDGA